ncbi:MAG: helix-turn-helix domain-containing protein [Muribaculaceae bacterium]|nr:helix-turn-helix domain-containing protein [Muribaculaceae bacterium]
MVQKYLKKLGKNIQTIRKSKNLSQERLAEIVGKSRNYIGMIERGESNVPTKTLFEIADALNIPPKTFFEF